MSITIISKGWSATDKEFSCNNPKVGGKKELSKKKKKKCLNALKKLLKGSCTPKCKFGMLIKAYSLIKLILSIILISTFIQVYDSVPNFYHNSGVFKLQFVIIICITKAKVVTTDGITAMNDTKTKFMTLNMTEEASSLVSCSGNQLEKVTDFVYLGAWIATTEREKPRLGQLATS